MKIYYSVVNDNCFVLYNNNNNNNNNNDNTLSVKRKRKFNERTVAVRIHSRTFQISFTYEKKKEIKEPVYAKVSMRLFFFITKNRHSESSDVTGGS